MAVSAQKPFSQLQPYVERSSGLDFAAMENLKAYRPPTDSANAFHLSSQKVDTSDISIVNNPTPSI